MNVYHFVIRFLSVGSLACLKPCYTFPFHFLSVYCFSFTHFFLCLSLAVSLSRCKFLIFMSFILGPRVNVFVTGFNVDIDVMFSVKCGM